MGTTIFCLYSYPEIRLHQLVGSLEKDIMSGEVEWCPILHVRPKFDVFTLVAEKILTKNVHMCYSDRRKNEKEGIMSFSIFIFIYTIHLAYLKVYTKFENTGSNRNREICD